MTTYQRTPEQLKEHYEIEKQLAGRLLNSTHEERKTLYTAVYDECFQRVPHHPQLNTKASPQSQAAKTARQLRKLRPFLRKDATAMELGPGDCALALAVSQHVKQIYAIDVSQEITKGLDLPANFELIVSDGSSTPVAENSIDVAYSDQVMEHLHPDDALLQLRNIYKSLAPGGMYLCNTPSRLNGPHDISKYFDEVATGFHLREYTITELSNLFKSVGFSTVRVYLYFPGIRLMLPTPPFKVFEFLFGMLPYGIRRRIGSVFPLKQLLRVQLIGIK